MKRIIAISLVLVLVLSLCAAAFADYYPTVQYDSSSKNKLVKYGKKVTLKIKCYNGNNVFKKCYTWNSGWIFRAGFTIYAKLGSFNDKVADWSFSGDQTIKTKVSTKNLPAPAYGRINKFKLTATSWYRPTYGGTVYGWEKYKSTKTNLRVYR